VLSLLSTTFVLTTIGELYLSPPRLSLVTKVAPGRIGSTVMGVWFLSSFFGNYMSGILGRSQAEIPRPQCSDAKNRHRRVMNSTSVVDVSS
jgi:POT family proton-dependent oligopeptide transporter